MTNEPETKALYEIKTGRASWHQRRAGHIYSGTLIAEYTPTELAAFLAKVEARDEPHQVTRLAGPSTRPTSAQS